MHTGAARGRPEAHLLLFLPRCLGEARAAWRYDLAFDHGRHQLLREPPSALSTLFPPKAENSVSVERGWCSLRASRCHQARLLADQDTAFQPGNLGFL